MGMIEAFFIILLVGLLGLQFLKQLLARRRYPPGPLPLPTAGAMWQAGIRLYQDSLHKSGKTEQPAVTNENDLVFSNGHAQKQQRLIDQVTLQKLGRGEKGLEQQIQEEAQQLVKALARAKGQPLDPLVPITNSVCNGISAVVFGHRFPVEDEEFRKLTEAIDVALKYGGSFIYALYGMFPWLMKSLPGPHQKALSSREAVILLAKKEIEKHKKQQALHEPKDYIDFCLFQMKKSKDDQSSACDDDDLAQSVLDFFVSGAESTAIALHWALLLMATHPDIQGKVQKEMEDAFGSSHSICYQDWKKLAYTKAVIHEIQRAKYALLFGIIRQCVKDVNVFGFLMPKGTFINPDLHSILLDPKQWETPEKFNPNHFLDKDGHFVARGEFLLSDSGAGVCLQEQVAQMELVLLFTNVLRAFTFQLPEGEKEVKTQSALGLTTYPHSYKLRALPRHGAPPTKQ
ncbi:hypothetical protein lerEdw1_021039 [Lerista edwardsae]|nr:hypothetical protein lerEdw1_021039 [Lerista edwardsae]